MTTAPYHSTANIRIIDWNEVKQRLAMSTQALALALTPNPDLVRATLIRRAARLRVRDLADLEPRGVAALTFCLGSETYAIELDRLAEVALFPRCAKVPGTPPHLLGVINQRGHIRPVVDLAQLLGLAAPGMRTGGYVVFVRKRPVDVGLWVETLDRVRRIEAAEAAPGFPGRFVRAVTADALILLDPAAVLEAAGFGDDKTTRW
ncbi:MAG: chemotaxis protein CheW [Alphaproteobacteria bacterium]|nr:chemotaxis protein CheW [Alphaproteobacteria bacterium]